MNWLTKLWAFIQHQEKQPTQVSVTDLLFQIHAILTSLDAQQQAITAQLSSFERHMDLIHERQLATLDKLSFMVRAEERQIMHMTQRMDEQDIPRSTEEQGL